MRLLVIALIALQIVIGVRAVGHYSVIGPGTVHPDHKYSVSVGVYDVNEPCRLEIGIIGPKDYKNLQTVELLSNEIKILDFVVPKLESEGNYNLTAEGTEGLIFKNTTKLLYKEFHPYVKIQTDKGKYKPGDVVNFRVLFLDENLKPGKLPEEPIVWIEDAKRNRVKEYKNLKLTKGVYTGQYNISEYALLGYWRLIANNGEQYFNPMVGFNVEKYVLPKYAISVTAPQRVSVRDGDMQVVVHANYTYGKPVTGKVTLVLNLFSYYNWNTPDKERKNPPPILKTGSMVGGKAKIDLNVKEYVEYMSSNTTSHSASIVATVEEDFTGVVLNGTTHSTFYPYRYSITCPDYSICTSFKPNEEKEFVISILHVDNSKIDDTKSVVKLHLTEVLTKNEWFFSNSENKDIIASTPPPLSGDKKFVFESHLNGSSVAVFKVKLDDLPDYKGYTHNYEMKIEFVDETHTLYPVYQQRPPEKTDEPEKTNERTEWFYASVHYGTDKWTTDIGSDITVAVNSSQPMSYLVYHVTGRANILESKRITLPEPKKEHNFTITTNVLMAPGGTILIHYIDEKGELHFCETGFNVVYELQNKIEITAADEVKPGSEVALKIKTQPHSFVGLLAVDQSVLLLGRNNDIKENEFRWRLSNYRTSTPWQGGHSPYPGQQCGLVTLTNADYLYNRTQPVWLPVLNREGAVSSQSFSASSGMHPMRVPAPAAGMGGVPTLAGESLSPSEPRIRKNFEETWLFTDIEDTQSEEFTWTKQIPDTITSWVVSGFSMNEEKGLGVVKDTTKIRTFQPFFVSLRLPYAVKRGEVINVPALVFNYLEKDLDVELTLDNSDGEYEFVEASNEVIAETKRVKTVRVPANSARGASFLLRLTTVGNIMLKFTAVSPIAGDAIYKTLKVVPEGVTEYANRAYFVNLKDVPEFKESFELELPKDVVPDSQHIEFGVVGDLLGPVLDNLEKLVRLPLGCGEQVTSTIVPNYLILNYLKSTNKLTDKLERKLIRNLEVGYENLQRYRNEDGSFSVFTWYRNNEKRNGSTWLTAYVVHTLRMMSPYVIVDQKLITDGVGYLIKQQAENGSFLEIDSRLYVTEEEHIRRTAKVLLTFIDDPLIKMVAPVSEDEIEKGFNYILNNVDKLKSLNDKTFIAYALHRAKHPAAKEHLQNLKSLAKSDLDRMWWSDREENNAHWWRWTYFGEIEATSYALLILLDQENETSQTVLPIVKWLVAQRNSNGGFSSTQDTVVGLKALMKFAEKSGYEPARMNVDFTTKGSERKDTIKVTDDNDLLLQSVELPPKTIGVDFHATGTGAALIQVAYQYNIVEKEKKPSFVVESVINKEKPTYTLEMDVCVEYTGEGDSSNMAIVEVSLPSGYVADLENFESIEKVEGVRLVETKNKETVVVVYFGSLHKEQTECLPIVAYRQYPVAFQKPVPIVVYDYYDTSKKATNYYEVVSKMCEICEDDEDCKKKC